MAYLLTTTFIWAFSFSLIGHYLSPVIDSWSLSFFRTLIALLVFIPFIDIKISRKHMLFMILIGAVQIGIMYLMYLNAFQFTSVSKILLFRGEFLFHWVPKIFPPSAEGPSKPTN